MDEEQVIARRNLIENYFGVLIILQHRLTRRQRRHGYGIVIGSLPCVNRHGQLDVIAVVGTELGLHTRNWEEGVQTDAHTLVDVVNDYTFSGVVKFNFVQHILRRGTDVERIFNIFGKPNLEFGFASLLLSVKVHEPLGVHGRCIGPDTSIVAGVVDVKEVLTGRLGIEGHPVAMTVHHGIKSLGGNGLAFHCGLKASLPLVDRQGTGGVLLCPGRHIEAKGIEGILDACAIRKTLTDTNGLSIARAVLDGVLLFRGGRYREGQNRRDRSQHHE